MTDPIIRLKRSEVPNKIPTVNQLLTGELAVNSFDGKVFLKQDTSGVGISTRVIEVGIGGSIGKTIFVTKSGNDENSGLNERDAKATIKAAAEIAFQNDTIKVYAGSYVEDNPIVLRKDVSVEGLELRNCLVTPGNPDLDLFHVNDGVHLTDLSFVGQPSEDGASIISFVPLEGVSSDRYFDASRLIRYNLDYIARETVGFLTSGYSGFAGGHREQDAARLIDLNIDFIASEAVGYLTSTQYKTPAFVVPTGDPNDCRDDIIDILQSLTYDLRATGNEKMVGAGLSYYPEGSLAHITGQDINGYDVDIATIETLEYAVGIATHIINNYPWGSVPSGNITNVTGFIYDNVTGLSTVTSVGHGVTTGDIVRLEDLTFSCPGGSGITTTIFPDGTQGFFFKVVDYLNANSFTINPGISTIQHTYVSGGTVEKYTNFQDDFTQIFDPSVIKSKIIYPNFGGCPGVANSISYLVGVVTSIIGAGTTEFAPEVISGINLDTFKCSRDIVSVWKSINYDITRGGNTKCIGAAKSYFDEHGVPLESILKNTREFEYTISALDYSFDIARCIVNNATWGGIAVGTSLPVSNIVYDIRTGLSTITVNNHGLTKYDAFKLQGLEFSCPPGSPGKEKNVISAFYDRITGITTIGLSTNHNFSTGDRIELQNLVFECDSSGGPSTEIYPSGNLGFEFTVLDINSPEIFTTNVGVSTLDHDYIGGGTVRKLFTPQIDVSDAVYDRITGIVTITAPGVYAEIGNKIRIENLVFECDSSGGPSTEIYPSGNLGFDFDVVGIANGRYIDASNLIRANKLEIIDKSLASIAISHPKFSFPGDDRTTPRSRFYDAYRLIQQNKDEIVNLAYDDLINNGPGDPSGNESKCKRDIGFFVDAVSTDIFTGGNTYSIEFTKQYFDGSGNPIPNGILGEESESVYAFESAKNLMKLAVTNQLTVKDTSVSIGSTIFGDGTEPVENTDLLACSDVQLTLDNLVNIITTVLSDGNLSSLSIIKLNYGSFEDGQSKCRRDIGYLVEALIRDLKNDSNRYTREFVKAYFDLSGNPISNGLVGEEVESITAFNSVAEYSKLAITNQLNNKDLTIIADPITGFNTDVNSCADVKSTIDNLVGIVTTIITDGNLFNLPDLSFSDTLYFNVGVSTLDHTYVGGGTLTLGITTNIFPDNTYGVIFPVDTVIDENTFISILGGSNGIDHTYVGGGTLTYYKPFQTENSQIRDLNIQIDPLVGVNDSPAGCADVVSAMRSCVGIVTNILGIGVSFVRGAENPTGIDVRYQGNNGKGSFIPNDPSFSPGTDGPVLKGPYIRNCTNFVPLSIGMKIDGFSADPGDKDDIGVQGSMSVDSYTQYNQGGIGVSITNGAYAQLVSIFTICTDEAIVTENGGQCDITNSNSSFGRLGLVSRRTSDNTSKSIYRYTGFANTSSNVGDIEISISGLGTQRPYDGQVLYIGELFFSINSIQVIDGGSGYTSANDAVVTIDVPTGPNGITAQAIPTVVDGRVTEITLINSGTQYQSIPNINISPPPSGTQAFAQVSLLDPLYYKVSSATLPSGGVSTVTLVQGLVNNVSIGDTVYLERQSLQIASSHSFEYVGAGNNIFTARPSVGGVTIQENEVVKENGGDVIYTSTDQAGNFRIGDGVVIDQASGTISGRTYIKSLFNNVTPFILALGD
jgi:hypothetical protein